MIADKPGLVAVATGELTRYVNFWVSMMRLEKPDGCIFNPKDNGSAAKNLNDAISDTFDDIEWAWLNGDDHVFSPDILMNLLWRDVDIVAPVVWKRAVPPQTVAYKADEQGVYKRLGVDDIPTSGLFEVDLCGGSGLLVKKHVFEKVEFPWFELGKTKADEPGEDIWFCHKAKKAGFKVYLDCSVVMGHTTAATIWPKVVDGQWTAEIDIRGSERFVYAADKGDG